MKAVILAAGEGSRMRPLTFTRPKVMIPIANKPIVEHLMLEARAAGIKEFVFIVGYHDEQVRSYFGNGEKWGVGIEYTSQRQQLGTADAVRMVEGMVQGNFLMMNGDIIVSQDDIKALTERSDVTMSVYQVEDMRDLGAVEVRDDRVARIHEKVESPPSNLANAGMYLFTPEIFAAIEQTQRSPRGEYEITDSIQLLIEDAYPVAYRKIGYWLDLSYPWDLLAANEAMLAKLKSQNSGEVEANVSLKGAVSIGKGTVVRSGAYIVGPVAIGRNCKIGPNCFIRPATSIGDNCHIGAAVEVKNSIIMSNSNVPHLNYVGDSVIGEGCNLGAGTKTANLRLDEKEIWVGGRNTGRRKLGAIMGDNVETGINSNINVGTMIGNNTQIGPGALARGVISPGSRIF